MYLWAAKTFLQVNGQTKPRTRKESRSARKGARRYPAHKMQRKALLSNSWVWQKFHLKNSRSLDRKAKPATTSYFDIIFLTVQDNCQFLTKAADVQSVTMKQPSCAMEAQELHVTASSLFFLFCKSPATHMTISLRLLRNRFLLTGSLEAQHTCSK